MHKFPRLYMKHRYTAFLESNVSSVNTDHMEGLQGAHVNVKHSSLIGSHHCYFSPSQNGFNCLSAGRRLASLFESTLHQHSLMQEAIDLLEYTCISILMNKSHTELIRQDRCQ